MDSSDERIRQAVANTEIIRLPRQRLSTFGTTNVHYYLVTEPVYTELDREDRVETVVREGRVIAERPRIVTPAYLSHLRGFSQEAEGYLRRMMQHGGPNSPGLFYTYRNQPHELSIVSGGLQAVVDRINQDIDKRNDPLASIVKGKDDMWDVSLLKFIYEMTMSSVMENLSQMQGRGLLNIDRGGVPMDGRVRIEELFSRVAAELSDPQELKNELDRWGVFGEYEDRFLDLFRKKGRH